LAYSSFDAEYVSSWRNFINNDAAFQVLVNSLDEIRDAIEKAKAKGCIYFKDKGNYETFTVQMTFGGPEGRRCRKSFRFKEPYEVISKTPISLESKFRFFLAIYNLVRNYEGIKPWYVDWETGLDYSPCHARKSGPPRSAAHIRKI
jgi:hypothetical protein